MTGAGDLPRVDFTAADTVRLISTAHIDEPAMAPLADDDDELAILEEIEALTSARRAKALPVPAGLDPAELLTAAHGYGWTHVNAAFCYTREDGNRFNSRERGAWYAAHGTSAVATAQAEVGWHLTRELEATGIFDNLTAYREIWAGFTARMYDLSGFGDADILHPDPDVAYPLGQALARDVLGAGGNGILYPSVRRADGSCLVALRPHLVQNVRPGGTWNFRWSGSPVPAVSPG